MSMFIYSVSVLNPNIENPKVFFNNSLSFSFCFYSIGWLQALTKDDMRKSCGLHKLLICYAIKIEKNTALILQWLQQKGTGIYITPNKSLLHSISATIHTINFCQTKKVIMASEKPLSVSESV